MTLNNHPPWRLWQFIDTAFPSGGFAHSAGLEASWRYCAIQDRQGLADFFEASLRQAGRSGLLFVKSAFLEPDRLAEFLRLYHAFLSNHVANRASRAQGAALLASTAKAFPETVLPTLRRTMKQEDLPSHFAPLFGVIAASLGFHSMEAGRAFLFILLRDLISSAVRLNAIGPLEGQRIQGQMSALAEDIMDTCWDRTIEEFAHTCPMQDLHQANHEFLYTRLFQS